MIDGLTLREKARASLTPAPSAAEYKQFSFSGKQGDAPELSHAETERSDRVDSRGFARQSENRFRTKCLDNRLPEN
ncbi:hypothetical protein [Caballeronia sp. INDeC2]|uniref:hypothetical protein n=1 Tax=Caballeronia sp. INDeC2 TaxID=2921747 RepID=UPI002027CE39|nr:hypothetical protein [Caballeronia sp. INDeC2]